METTKVTCYGLTAVRHSPASLCVSLLFSLFPAQILPSLTPLPAGVVLLHSNVVLCEHIPDWKSKHIKKRHSSLITSSTSGFFYLLFSGKTMLRGGFYTLIWRSWDFQKGGLISLRMETHCGWVVRKALSSIVLTSGFIFDSVEPSGLEISWEVIHSSLG